MGWRRPLGLINSAGQLYGLAVITKNLKAAKNGVDH
jgi:hypothetical protein